MYAIFATMLFMFAPMQSSVAAMYLDACHDVFGACRDVFTVCHDVVHLRRDVFVSRGDVVHARDDVFEKLHYFARFFASSAMLSALPLAVDRNDLRRFTAFLAIFLFFIRKPLLDQARSISSKCKNQNC